MPTVIGGYIRSRHTNKKLDFNKLCKISFWIFIKSAQLAPSGLLKLKVFEIMYMTSKFPSLTSLTEFYHVIQIIL